MAPHKVFFILFVNYRQFDISNKYVWCRIPIWYSTSKTNRDKLGFKEVHNKFLTMANIKDDLDQYLLLRQDQKKTSFKIDMKMPTLNVSDVKNLFGKSESAPEANGWLQDTRDSCCPKMVKKRIHFFFKFCIISPILCHFSQKCSEYLDL